MDFNFCEIVTVNSEWLHANANANEVKPNTLLFPSLL